MEPNKAGCIPRSASMAFLPTLGEEKNRQKTRNGDASSEFLAGTQSRVGCERAVDR